MASRLSTCALALLLAPAMLAAAPGAARAAGPLTFEAELESAPYHVPGEPNVGVHVPAGFDATQPLHLVVYVHGLRGCLPVLLGEGSTRCDASAPPQLGWSLGAHHDAAGTHTIFVVPRLRYDKRRGQPGAFGKDGGFRAFIEELAQGPLSSRLGRRYGQGSVASVTLVAHSAGYETALAILEHGRVDDLVRAVVLLDALYALHERYARYALEPAPARERRLIVVHLRGGRPAREGAKLHARLERVLGRERVVTARADALRAAVAAHPFVFAEGRPPHGRVPAHHMADVLSALGLPERARGEPSR